MNEGGKSSRQLRKRAPAARLVDEPGGEDHDIDGSDSASSRVTNDEDCEYDHGVSEEEDDDEYTVKSASKKKPTSSKSKKPVADRGKTARKRTRKKEPAEQTTQERPKNFSHSNRNKRRVNDDLLNTPEDEIDFQRLPIRDIILLAEHKERLAVKEAKTSNSTTQRTGNTFNEDGSHNEDQDGGFTEEQTYRRQPSLSLFNHQSFMDKTPSARWSKDDTELFYEAVRQFGSDLSMIQQLFPGRTRHEIKLKFKKEGRQHPLRFCEAQSHRCPDYSFFKKLIDRLQEAGTRADQESKRDGSNSSANSQAAAMNSESNEEVAKSGLDEDVATEDQEEEVAKSKPHEDAATEDPAVNVTEVQNTSQSGEMDDDDDDDNYDGDDIWNSYKSEL